MPCQLLGLKVREVTLSSEDFEARSLVMIEFSKWALLEESMWR